MRKRGLTFLLAAASSLPLGAADVVNGKAEPGLGWTPDELRRIRSAPEDSSLGRLRKKVLDVARKSPEILPLRPGCWLSNGEDEVPRDRMIRVDNFLAGYGASLDALGAAFALTGDEVHARAVSAHLRSWDAYDPPHGKGGKEGAQAPILHRNLYGLLRAAWLAWPALPRDARASTVRLSRVFQDLLEDWWGNTPWARGNFQAASNQTGIFAALLLARAAVTDPDLVTPAEAERRLRNFLSAGRDLPRGAMLSGNRRHGCRPGMLGFEPHLLLAVYHPGLEPLYAPVFAKELLQEGASLDFCYKPARMKMEYHLIALHHVLVTQWALSRSGLDAGRLEHPAEVRAQIGRMLEFLRLFLADGRLPEGARTGDHAPGDVAHPLVREILLLGAFLFPEKGWIRPLLDRAESASAEEVFYLPALD